MAKRFPGTIGQTILIALIWSLVSHFEALGTPIANVSHIGRPRKAKNRSGVFGETYLIVRCSIGSQQMVNTIIGPVLYSVLSASIQVKLPGDCQHARTPNQN